MKRLRVGVVGTGFIARPHLSALAQIGGDGLPRIELAAACDERPEAARETAVRFGIERVAADWRDITGDPGIDAVLVLTPNDLHAPVALDALRHGKHVLCEKPLADSAAAAASLCTVAEGVGTAAQVAFVYRAWPAVALARELVAGGEIGEPLDFRARFLHDYALDPAHPHSWRFERARAGAGSLGDLGSHLIDLALALMGEIADVRARTRTLIPSRDGRAVDVDDMADVWLQFASGATGALRTSWAAAGHRTDLGFEVLGTRGSIGFAWRRPNELRVGDRTVEAPNPLWPVPGVGLGWADAFVLNALSFVRAAAGQVPATPSFNDGLRVAQVVEAAVVSAR